MRVSALLRHGANIGLEALLGGLKQNVCRLTAARLRVSWRMTRSRLADQHIPIAEETLGWPPLEYILKAVAFEAHGNQSDVTERWSF